MVKCLPIDYLHSMSYHHKFGTPCGLGRFAFGKSELGEENDLYGVYRRQPTKNGEIIVKMDFYCPVNLKTPEQLIRRDLMARAIVMWQNISEPEREYWRNAAEKKPYRGYQMFLKSIFEEFKLYGLGVAPLGNQLYGKDGIS